MLLLTQQNIQVRVESIDRYFCLSKSKKVVASGTTYVVVEKSFLF